MNLRLILITALLVACSTFSRAATLTLVQDGSSMRYLIPTSDSVDAVWRDSAFDDSGWTDGLLDAGYDPGPGFSVQTNLSSEMRGINSTAYFRVPFEIVSASQVSSLMLGSIIDDGAIFYINGTQVASFQSPASPAWDSEATFSVSGSGETTLREFDLSGDLNTLVNGTNILAIHGMNRTVGSSDFHIFPTLTAETIPEPSSLCLLVTAALLSLRRTRH